jgi:hypothetical protein
MSPTIRIDDEVYAWLQQKAAPFEDTPNTVLRRIAGLGGDASVSNDSPTRRAEGVSGMKTNSGRALNEQWNIGAEHALYHKDGKWYERLEKFPGALCDPNGYVLFATEREFLECPALNIGIKVNVVGGIRSLPSYRRMR